MSTAKKHIVSLTRMLILACITMFISGLSLYSQTESSPQVDEVILDSVSFKNADTTLPEPADEYFEDESEDEKEESEEKIVIYRSVPDSISDRLKKDKQFEYANDPRYWIKEEEKDNRGSGFDFGSLGPVISFIMYCLLAAAILFVVYRLIVSNNLFYSKSPKLIKVSEDVDTELTEEDIDKKIEQAVSTRNYRLATRFLFIKSLKKLDARGLIRFHPQATNYDYLNQVSGHSVAADFGFVTRVYEFVWYGEFDINEEQFQSTRIVFDKIFNITK